MGNSEAGGRGQELARILPTQMNRKKESVQEEKKQPRGGQNFSGIVRQPVGIVHVFHIIGR